MQTEFEFILPKGYLDENGTIHQRGIMRLSRAMDEIVPLRDPRVKSNPAYATVMILSRVIVRLGSLEEVTPGVVENFFTRDLDYLQTFYRQINDLTHLPENLPNNLPQVSSNAGGGEAIAPNPAPVPKSVSANSSNNLPMSSDEYIWSQAVDGAPIMPPSPRARATAQQES
jgi:hypothetical protein